MKDLQAFIYFKAINSDILISDQDMSMVLICSEEWRFKALDIVIVQGNYGTRFLQLFRISLGILVYYI